jgi:hypothetical protein
MASQSNPADLISTRIVPTIPAKYTLWWKTPQWLSHEPSSWPTIEFNTSTDNLEIRNVHVACLQTLEDITQRLPSNVSDDSAFNSSLQYTYCLSRTHQTSSCWATTLDSFCTRELLDNKNLKLSENSYSSMPLTCYRFTDQTTQQLTDELPSTRVQISRAFLSTGVDYAGPISLTLGTTRSETVTKGYIVIFVCFVTKAHRHYLNYWSTPCYPETFHGTSRKTKGNIFRQ